MAIADRFYPMDGGTPSLLAEAILCCTNRRILSDKRTSDPRFDPLEVFYDEWFDKRRTK